MYLFLHNFKKRYDIQSFKSTLYNEGLYEQKK